MRSVAVLTAALAVLATAGCGQRGPLYLRDNPPPGMKVPKPAAAKPVPYPAEGGSEAAPSAPQK